MPAGKSAARVSHTCRSHPSTAPVIARSVSNEATSLAVRTSHGIACSLTIRQLGFINGVGPRVAESILGTIPGFAYAAPYEDITLNSD
jgi:hypothetical protein